MAYCHHRLYYILFYYGIKCIQHTVCSMLPLVAVLGRQNFIIIIDVSLGDF